VRALAIIALAFFLLLSVGYSLTRAPWWDEGVFADVALTFRYQGHLGSTTLAPHGYLNLPSVDRYTYWQMPLYLTVVGVLLRAMPADIESIRLFSVLCGCIYLVGWFVFVRCLSRNDTLTLVVVSLIALDYSFVATSSDGRMDMMAAALGQAALALYMYFRESSWKLAVFLAACCGAAAFFTHPAALIPNAMLLALVSLDWKRIRWSGLLLAMIPYLIGVGVCVWYILQAPQIFVAQRHAELYRTSSFTSTLWNLVNDAGERYVYYYFSGLAGINKLKVLSLFFAVAGIVGLIFVSRPALKETRRVLLVFSAIAYLALAVIDNMKLPVYFIYSMPVFTACGAVWMYEWWIRGGTRRLLATGLFVASAAATIGGFSYKIYKNDYRNEYLPAIAEVRKDLRPGYLLMAGSELGFGLGFRPPLTDDRYLGYFSGSRPQIYVMNDYYVGMPEPALERAWASSRQTLREHYHLAFQNALYKIYVQKK